MIARRSLLILLPAIGIGACGRDALAKNKHNNNGHQLIGDKINRNGKHIIGKAGRHDVVAEVASKKVVNMAAGDLPVRKVKSSRRMSGRDSLIFPVVASAETQFAQVVAEIWYAFCFDDGLDEYCYWYPALYVVVNDGWVEYVPA